MYLKYSSNLQYNPDVYKVQVQLNNIRQGRWSYIDPDGKFGPKTKEAVMAYQRNREGLPVSGDVDDKTYNYLMNERYSIITTAPPSLIITNRSLIITSQPPNTGSLKKKGIGESTYGVVSTSVKNFNTVHGMLDSSKEGKSLSYLLNEWLNLIVHQGEGLARRIDKIPVNKQLRVRNLQKHLNGAKKFIEKAQKLGINKAAQEMASELTKENTIKYLENIANIIRESQLTKSLKAVTVSFGKIEKMIQPVTKVLKRIPGLNYWGAIEKFCKGTKALFAGNYEKAFTLFMDALREIVESLLVDALVVAAIAAGGWVLLVIAIIVIIGILIIDYLYFSDDPGESLVDKYTSIKTRNIIYEQAPQTYRIISDTLF